jgi:hypothetical protein
LPIDVVTDDADDADDADDGTVAGVVALLEPLSVDSALAIGADDADDADDDADGTVAGVVALLEPLSVDSALAIGADKDFCAVSRREEPYRRRSSLSINRSTARSSNAGKSLGTTVWLSSSLARCIF